MRDQQSKGGHFGRQMEVRVDNDILDGGETFAINSCLGVGNEYSCRHTTVLVFVSWSNLSDMLLLWLILYSIFML